MLELEQSSEIEELKNAAMSPNRPSCAPAFGAGTFRLDASANSVDDKANPFLHCCRRH